MDLLLSVGLPLALAVIMLSLGIGLTVGDFARVLTQPRAVLVGLTAQLLGAPLAALALVIVFAPPPEIAVGVMILAFCPGGVTSTLLTRFARGRVALSVTLTGVASLISVVTLPLLTGATLEGMLGDAAPSLDVTALALAMAGITALPVAIGVAIRALSPSIADRLDPPLAWIAGALFLLIIGGALAANWTLFAAEVAVLGPLLVTLNLGLLGLGFLLARLLRLARPDAVAIALETGIQNGTLGIAVGSLLVEASAGLPPFSLPSGVYGITMYIVTLPIAAWLRAAAPRA